jgi:hypothetical protein
MYVVLQETMDDDPDVWRKLFATRDLARAAVYDEIMNEEAVAEGLRVMQDFGDGYEFYYPVDGKEAVAAITCTVVEVS